MFPFQPAPIYTQCPIEHAPISKLPPLIQALSTSIPGLMLDGILAREFVRFYSAEYHGTTTPLENEVNATQTFKFVVCEDTANYLGYITAQRAASLIQMLQMQYFVGTAEVTWREPFSKIKGTIQGVSVEILFSYSGLVMYLSRFDGDKKMLIDLDRSWLFFKNVQTFHAAFANPPAVNAPDEHRVVAPSESDTNSTPDASSVNLAANGTAALGESDTDSTSDTSSVSEGSSVDNTSKAHLHEAKATLTSTQQPRLPKPKKKKHDQKRAARHEAPAAITHTDPPAATPRASIWTYTSTITHTLSNWFPSKATPKKRYSPLTYIAPTRPKTVCVHSDRYKFFEAQPFGINPQLSIEPAMFSEAFIEYMKVKKQLPFKDQADLKKKIKSFMGDSMVGCVKVITNTESARQQQIDQGIDHETVSSYFLLTAACWLCSLWIVYNVNVNERKYESLNEQVAVVGIFIASIFLGNGFLATQSRRLQFFDEVMIGGIKTQLQDSQSFHYGRLVLAMMLYQGILEPQSRVSIFKEPTPLQAFFMNIMKLVYLDPTPKNMMERRVFNREAMAHLYTETITSLVEIHGTELLPMIMRNDVPEISIAISSEDDKLRLFGEEIAALKLLIDPAEQVRKGNKKYRAPEPLIDKISESMNRLCLIYAVRNPTKDAFKTFEAMYPEFTMFVTKEMDDYLKENKLMNVHQCPIRSRLFDMTLQKNRALALATLEILTRPENPVLSWETPEVPQAVPQPKYSPKRK